MPRNLLSFPAICPQMKPPYSFRKLHHWLKPRKIGVWIGLAIATFGLVLSTAAVAQIPGDGAIELSVEPERIERLDPVQLEREGRALYDRGQFRAAAGTWQEAARTFTARGDLLGQAGSLSYRSMALYELGELEAAQTDLDRAFQLLSLEPGTGSHGILAQILNNRGRIQLALGDAQGALETWQQASEAYHAIDDRAGELGATVNQALALQSLGLYRRARRILEGVEEQLAGVPDSRVKAAGLRNLGITLQMVGDPNRSQAVLETALAIDRQFNFPPDLSATLRALGNTARALPDPEAALTYYREAVRAADELPHLEIPAGLNALGVLVQLERTEEAFELASTLRQNLNRLSIGRSTVYAKVNFAEHLIDLTSNHLDPERADLALVLQDLATLLGEAIETAGALQDPRAESYATGQLAHLYEASDRFDDAAALTQEALRISLGNRATDITAKWATQLGRILKRQGKLEDAIAAYSEAVRALRTLRQDLVSINTDVQLSFQESVEPVYRELVGLLLQSPNPSQANLVKARETIENLQIAELDNFFREACLTTQPIAIDELDPTAAVIYPIVVPISNASPSQTRIEVLLSLPGKPLKNYKTVIPQAQFEETLDRFRQSLSLSFPKSERLAIYARVYDWLIRPIVTDLESSRIETLVFVLDGSLRNLPMAVLYDGERYAIEKYNLALSPGLQLLEPQPLDRTQLQATIGGLSEARQGFPALPNVEFELERIGEKIISEVWLDGEFTTETVRSAIASTDRPILHLATHGQFSSNVDETFILTWDGRIPITELASLLQARDETRTRTIELLVLSACQTAKGDNRAILGLAGFAVKSGARSTLGTLWTVRDRSTADLIARFYQELSVPGTRKSQALRKAQLFLMEQPGYEHPFFWAPFVLVGNWL